MFESISVELLIAGFVALLGIVGMATYIIWGWIHQFFHPPEPAPVFVSAKGKVSYVDASLLGDITVMLLRDGRIEMCAQTLPDGSFSFESVPVGDYFVAAYKDVDAVAWLEGVRSVTVDSDNYNLDLSLSIMPEE
jgi:hypothetical protein